MQTAIKQRSTKNFRISVAGSNTEMIVPSNQVETVCEDLAEKYKQSVFVYTADGSQIFGVLGSTDCVGVYDPHEKQFHAHLFSYRGDRLLAYLEGGPQQEKTHIEIGHAENSDKEVLVFIEFKDEDETRVYHLSAETARWAADNLMRQADKIDK